LFLEGFFAPPHSCFCLACSGALGSLLSFLSPHVRQILARFPPFTTIRVGVFFDTAQRAFVRSVAPPPTPTPTFSTVFFPPVLRSIQGLMSDSKTQTPTVSPFLLIHKQPDKSSQCLHVVPVSIKLELAVFCFSQVLWPGLRNIGSRPP